MEELPPFTGELPYFPDSKVAHRAAAALPNPPRAGPSTVLFCWELGGGLGHLMQMLPLAEGLAKRGHRVYMALRDLDRAGTLYGRTGVSFLQAPAWQGGAPRSAPPVTFAQVLANCGFGTKTALFARACAWRNLFKLVGPDLLIVDHAPTALLASRGLPREPWRALIGSGFCCPPDGLADDGPWAVVRPEELDTVGCERLREADAQVLGRCNWVLGQWGLPAVDRLGQLYAEVDENFLTTFPELDHFPRRTGAGYWGPVISEAPGAEPPAWPDAPGPRALVYLKDVSAAEAALGALARVRAPAVAFIDGASADVRQRLEGPTVHVSPRPLDLRRAARECDLAVLGGGHGATAELLLAGKPVLELPSAREQRMVADAVARLGAGEVAPSKRPDDVRHKLSLMLASDAYRRAADRFARRYSTFDPRRLREAMLARCGQVLSARGGETASRTTQVRDVYTFA
jgi:hypothetical protein